MLLYLLVVYKLVVLSILVVYKLLFIFLCNPNTFVVERKKEKPKKSNPLIFKHRSFKIRFTPIAVNICTSLR